jgi:uncharacterized membrane protein
VNEGPDQRDADVVDTLFAYVDRVMDAIHDRVLRPLMLLGRFLAYGFILLLLALVVVSAGVIGVTRFATIYLFAHHVWITYLVVAAIFVGIGLFIWRKRRPVADKKS